MRAYLLVLDAILGKKQNGHAISNQKNKVSLAIANKEIMELLKCGE